MLVKAIAKVAVGAGLLGMLLTCGVRADDEKGLPGPIDSLGDLQDAGKMLFKLADTNNDNRISQKEAVDAGNLLAGGFFFRADANGDGTVTRDESRAAREALFNQKPLLRFIFERTRDETQRQGSQAADRPGEADRDEPAGLQSRWQLLSPGAAPGRSEHRPDDLHDGRQEW